MSEIKAVPELGPAFMKAAQDNPLGAVVLVLLVRRK